MPSSTDAQPLTTSLNSPDTLPQKGYTYDQLKNYILRQLGSPIWNVEITNQHVLDSIQDALALYSNWVPLTRVGNIQLVQGQFVYLQGEDVGLGIADVQFVEPNPVPTEIFYGNLINPAPLFRTGLDEYDTFLRWRHTWQRVTSIKPDWMYDEPRKSLYIHNPIERFQAGIFYYDLYNDTQDLNLQGSLWVKEFALEQARYTYGEILAKFGNAIPSPVQNLALDSQKRANAEKRIDILKEKLQGMQLLTAIVTDDN